MHALVVLAELKGDMNCASTMLGLLRPDQSALAESAPVLQLTLRGLLQRGLLRGLPLLREAGRGPERGAPAHSCQPMSQLS
eukprot:1155858-Pelagomonas_calceolata.AAC.2